MVGTDPFTYKKGFQTSQTETTVTGNVMKKIKSTVLKPFMVQDMGADWTRRHDFISGPHPCLHGDTLSG